MSPSTTLYEIVDRDTGRRYLDVRYWMHEAARQIMVDMLRPYPADHEWRRRLYVRPVGPTEPPEETPPCSP